MLSSLLPSHWEVIPVGQIDSFYDDGRDYDMPMYMRKDGLARIYINKNEHDTEYMFAISWDEHSDGDCLGDFREAIAMADRYLDHNPL